MMRNEVAVKLPAYRAGFFYRAALHLSFSRLPHSRAGKSLAAMGVVLVLAVATQVEAQPLPDVGWVHYGNDAGGTRFSQLGQITPGNVAALIRAWEFRTGDLKTRDATVMARTKFQATPLLVESSVIFCSPFNEVIALDPGTGQQKWRFDPKIAANLRPANRYNCRGVAYWQDRESPAGGACRSRILMGTNDARVVALDARTGLPCAEFGTNGEVISARACGTWSFSRRSRGSCLCSTETRARRSGRSKSGPCRNVAPRASASRRRNPFPRMCRRCCRNVSLRTTPSG